MEHCQECGKTADNIKPCEKVWCQIGRPERSPDKRDALIVKLREHCADITNAINGCEDDETRERTHAFDATHLYFDEFAALLSDAADALSAPSTTPRSEAAERVANFLRVLDRVWPNHPDRLLTTGAATALLKSDLQALVSVASATACSEEPMAWAVMLPAGYEFDYVVHPHKEEAAREIEEKELPADALVPLFRRPDGGKQTT